MIIGYLMVSQLTVEDGKLIVLIDGIRSMAAMNTPDRESSNQHMKDVDLASSKVLMDNVLIRTH